MHREIPALELSTEEDISALSAWLWQRRIAHRVFERQGRQCLVVFAEDHVDLVQGLYQEWRSGLLQIRPVTMSASGGDASAAVRVALRRSPLCALLVLGCLLGGALLLLDTAGRVVALLTFTPLQFTATGLSPGSLGETLRLGQWWRLLTPIFLHFGVLHLVFNLLWLWEIGRRVESRQGAAILLGLTVLTGIGGNFGQYLSSGSALFGGMSGVIYGLLGYTWLWGRLRPAESFHLPAGIMTVMMVWLLICASGLVEALGLGAIANAAHLSGLLLGLLAALLLSRVPGPV